MDETKTSAEEQKPAVIKKVSLNGMTVGLMLLASVIGAITSVGGFYALAGSGKTVGQKTVVLNTDRLSKAAIKQIVDDKTLTNEQAALVGQKLASNMKALAADYQAKGYIIIDSRALMVWPGDIEITTQFAEKLGVKLD